MKCNVFKEGVADGLQVASLHSFVLQSDNDFINEIKKMYVHSVGVYTLVFYKVDSMFNTVTVKKVKINNAIQ